MRCERAARRGSTSPSPFLPLGSISMPGRAPTARFIIGRMFTAWTAQRTGIKRGGRRDVAEAFQPKSRRHSSANWRQHRERRLPCALVRNIFGEVMPERNIFPYDGQAILIDD